MKRLALWGPVVLVMVLIFLASSSSDPGAPPGGLSDKSAHFLAYGALGAALARALAGGLGPGIRLRHTVVAFLLATLYGVTDEIHQRFVPERQPDMIDVAADAAGGLAGAAGTAALGRTLARVRRRRPA